MKRKRNHGKAHVDDVEHFRELAEEKNLVPAFEETIKETITNGRNGVTQSVSSHKGSESHPANENGHVFSSTEKKQGLLEKFIQGHEELQTYR